MNSDNVETYDPTAKAVITVTDNAVKQVQILIDDMKDEPVIGLRVFVQGGGCSGFQYGFTFEEEIGDDDTVIEQDGVKFLVDELSYQYLAGSVIDYKTELFGARFEISNPNVSTSCGCGKSFAT